MDERKNFGSKLGVVMAAAGSAVGLGNVWRFPTEVGNNGGAAFILIYLLCVAFVGLPVMLGEFVIGRHTHANTISAYQQLAPGKWWRIQGVNGVFVAFMILSYYIVIAGWTLYYLVQALAFRLSGPQDYTQVFSQFVSSPWQPLLCAVVFMLMTHLVIARGVQSGIERFSKVMMPMLLLIICVLMVCSFSMPGTSESLTFLLKPDFAKVTPTVVLSAMGQAFFSLSIGMGCLITYSSYFGKHTNLQTTALQVTLLDTLVAVLAGVMIFPAVFSFGIAPTAGPELVFITLPNVFEQMPLGNLWSLVFFVLLALAALTSTISLHEVATAYMHEEWQMTRSRAAVYVSLGVLFFGSISSLSMGVLSEYTIGGLNFFDLLDYITAKIMLPLGGMLICLFVGQRVDKKILKAELTNEGTIPFYFFNTYAFFMKYIAPIAIGIIFLNELGLLRWLTGE